MAVKVTEQILDEGGRYSISGLTFNQIFRIKHAMYDAKVQMQQISNEFVKENNLEMAKQFMDYAKDAHDVFEAIACLI